MAEEKMDTNIAPGDKVAWNWGSSAPSGEAQEVKPDDITITTHRGNEVHKSGSPSNPAVKVAMSGGKPVVKQASELQVKKDGPMHGQAGSVTTMGEGKEGEKNGEKHGEKNGEKHGEKNGEKSGEGLKVPEGHTARGKSRSKSPAPAAEKPAEKEADKPAEKKADKPAEKEEKPAEKEEKTNGEAAPAAAQPKEKKKPGRKPGTANGKPAAKKEKVKKRAATESGEPRRSKRVKA